MKRDQCFSVNDCADMSSSTVVSGLKIELAFSGKEGELNHPLYMEIVRNSLRPIIDERVRGDIDFSNAPLALKRDRLLSLLPLVSTTKCSDLPGRMSFFAIAKERLSAFKFFYDMVRKWLIPGRPLNVVLIYSVDFRLPDFGSELYTFTEVMVCIDSKSDLDQITANLPAFETELQMGLASSHYARRLLETKGFAKNEKTALVQDHIAYLIDHLPRDFDHDALTEMQHVLLICKDEFIAARDCRLLSRIIGVQYLFRKRLREAVKKAPEKRHLKLKIFRTRLKRGEEQKMVLSVLVGVNFFREKEVLDKVHLLNAIKIHIPTAKAIENSFFANRRGSEHVCTMYLELEKTNQEQFTSEEIRLLRQELAGDLTGHIKPLLHPVFMPHNEEEIIRNILSLSSQLKYLRDIPQVFITFDEQTHSNIFFTIILVRVARPENLSIQEMFKKHGSRLEYIHDRCQYAGNLRKKYKKEATVFRVKLTKDQFLRADHTIDLNKARQKVAKELCDILGEIRDYNGGMISKQNEMLQELKILLRQGVKYSELMLENFFYSLTPVIMRSVLEPDALRTLFLMLLEAVETGKLNAVNVQNDQEFLFVMVKADDRSVKEELTRALNKLQLQSTQLATAFVTINNMVYVGYIYRSDVPTRQEHFVQVVHNALATWTTKKTGTLNLNEVIAGKRS